LDIAFVGLDRNASARHATSGLDGFAEQGAQIQPEPLRAMVAICRVGIPIGASRYLPVRAE